MIDWPVQLKEKDGATLNLPKIRFFCDFSWEDKFQQANHHFPGLEELADYINKACPATQQPTLILSTQVGAPQGHLPHDLSFIIAVNIDAYILHATTDLATTYLIRFAGIRPATPVASNSLTSEECPVASSELQLTPEMILPWINNGTEFSQSILRLLGDNIETTALVRGRETDIAKALVTLLKDDLWKVIESAGAEIPEALAQHRIWKSRAAAIADFEEHLLAQDWGETGWQKFFASNTWIFGFGLRYQFLDLLTERPYTGGRDYSGRGGQESDFLFASAAAKRFTVLVDIKKPDTDLVLDKLYRNRVYKLGPDLVGGVTQVQQQCWRWETEGSRTDDNRELLQGASAHGHRPAGVLVIGTTRSLNNLEKLRTFETFRRGLDLPEILTFDEMLERAKRFIALTKTEEEAS